MGRGRRLVDAWILKYDTGYVRMNIFYHLNESILKTNGAFAANFAG